MNFCLPINLDRLQNDRLRLVPLASCPTSTFEELIEETGVKHPELWQYFPHGPFETLESYMIWFKQRIESNAANILFAIFLKAGRLSKRIPGTTDLESFDVEEGTLVCTTGLTNASTENAKAEVGFAMVLPRFQRTFVNTDACCLLLKHLLDPVSGGDLGLRRVQWQANSRNQASIVAAQRLGLTFEGITRWERVMNDHKVCISESAGERTEGLPNTNVNGMKLGPGRHSAVLAICWDDWLDGKRDYILKLLSR